MAKIIRFHELGGPEVLRIDDVEVAAPGAGEVRIRAKALGLNRADALMRSGTYIETPDLPSGIGLEAAGIVDAVGPDVDAVAPGDAVSVVPPTSMRAWPVHGELFNVPAHLVVRHPPQLVWEDAAAVWMAYVTAYGALVDVAGLRSGDLVVVTAASSSVGLAAIQVARRVGALPVAVTRTSAKRQALLDAGAAHVIATGEEDLQGRLRDLAGADGVRVVFDAIGGPLFVPLAATMAHGGILIAYGGLSPEPTPFPLFDVLRKRLTLRGYLIHEIVQDPARLDAARRFVLDGLSAGVLRPVIAKTFPFERIADAHRYLESNEQFGKIVVTL
jgi:NADPH:quinone reductase-like Zn-dependent oxidoreductase